MEFLLKVLLITQLKLKYQQIVSNCAPTDNPSGTTTKLSGSKGLQLQHQRLLTVRSDDLLAERRTDRPQVPPHNQPPECFRFHRSPLTTALADNLLSAFGATDKTQTAASTTNLLGAFGATGDLEKQVQGLCAEPANGEVVRRQTSLKSRRQLPFRPHQRIVRPLAPRFEATYTNSGGIAF